MKRFIDVEHNRVDNLSRSGYIQSEKKILSKLLICFEKEARSEEFTTRCFSTENSTQPLEDLLHYLSTKAVQIGWKQLNYTTNTSCLRQSPFFFLCSKQQLRKKTKKKFRFFKERYAVSKIKTGHFRLTSN